MADYKFLFFQLLMHNEGDVVRVNELEDQGSGRISRLLWTVRNLVVQSSVKPGEILENKLVIVSLLKVRLLIASHFQPSIDITIYR